MKVRLMLALMVTSLVLLLLFAPNILMAQPNPEGDPDVPIDGGVSLLIAAGVAYGAKRIRDERKKNINRVP